jgi:hypothetical protein
MTQQSSQKYSAAIEGAAHGFTCIVLPEPIVGVLDEPYSAKPAQLSTHTGPPGYIGWTRQFQAPAYVDSDWQAFTATPLSGVS